MQYYERLVNSLKRGVISPVYLFYGEEIYLRERAVERFKEFLLPRGADFNMDVLDGESITPAEVVSAASTPPFMAERRLVLVKNPPWFAADSGKGAAANREKEAAGVKPLLDYLANPLTTTCLIFQGQTADRRKKIFKAVEKAGQAINFTLLKPAELAGWLDEQSRLRGIKIDRRAKELLITGTTSGLTGLISEWQKLITYIGERKSISVDDVNQVVHRSVEYKIFDVLDAIGSRRCGTALAGIRDLLANKEPPQVILAMVARQFRLMLQVNELAGTGLPAAEIAKQINEKPYPVKKALKLGKNFSRRQLISALTGLAQLDADIKTGRVEFYPGLEGLLLSMVE
ncbi:DNA polymerase-3 subunit delta [Desulfohalotomaculum tongense]|uniref:DNA polymerase III subunit delta n=1 Tax=Desulforadius tongensis TaxID=1216062 RepID=UPI001959F19F|nr:DNA polymerase III subunit delta [Desulforadius tongensis]MBM7855699.1 DNA polymerase-3 subunit delta [Desulforadius tongensis]